MKNPGDELPVFPVGSDTDAPDRSRHAQPTAAASTPAGWPARLLASVRRWSPWIRVAASAGLIYLVLRHTSLGEIGAVLGQILDRWLLLIVSAGLPAVGILISAMRWKVLLGGLDVSSRTPVLCRAMLVGMFFNFFLPSTIGGDVARSWWIQQSLGSTTLSLTVVALDRFIGLISICAVGLVAAVAQPSLAGSLPQIWIVAAIVGLAALSFLTLGHGRVAAAGRRAFSLPVLRRVRDKAAIAYEGLITMRRSKSRLATAFMLSTALQINVIVAFFVIGSALGADVSLWQFAILIPVVTLVTLLPVTINGIGLREASLAVLGANFGLGTDDAVALAWLYLAFQLSYALAGGVIYMLGRPKAQ